MGCDIHAILQKRNEDTGKWFTIDQDVFSGRDYNLFTFLSGVRGFETEYDNIAVPGLPEDYEWNVKVDTRGEYDLESGTTKDIEYSMYYDGDFWMGEHSFGSVTLEEFCSAETPDPDENRSYEMETFESGYTVRFLKQEDMDDYSYIRSYQVGLKALFGSYGGLSNYRLVFGYDS